MVTFAVTGYVASSSQWSHELGSGSSTSSTRISAVLSSSSDEPALILDTSDAGRFGSNLTFFSPFTSSGYPLFPLFPFVATDNGGVLDFYTTMDTGTSLSILRIARVRWGEGKETTLLEIRSLPGAGTPGGFSDWDRYTDYHIGGDFIDLPDEQTSRYDPYLSIGMPLFLRANRTEYLPVGPDATVASVAFEPSLFLWQVQGTFTEGDDTLTGSAGDEQLWGLGGHDVLDGGAGDDTLRGGPGWDTLIGGEGDDVLHGDSWGNRLLGGPGNDTISAGGDQSTVFGDEGDDSITGSPGADTIHAGDGNDTVLAGWGDDSVPGGDGDDSLSGSAGDDILEGEAGDDTLDGGEGDDSLDGGSGANRLIGGAGRDTLVAADGDDRLQGDDGDDSLSAGAGADTLFGGAGADSLDAAAGDDVLDGGDGNDTLEGGDGADFLAGGLGDDRLAGGDGDDTLSGGHGADLIDGGPGEDRATWAWSDWGVQVDLQTGATARGHAAGDTLSGIEHLEGSMFADTLAGDAGANRIVGLAGDDLLSGGGGDDTLEGGAGDDTLAAGTGNDALTGGMGADLFVLTPGAGTKHLADFAPGQDRLDLSGFAAAGLPPPVVSADAAGNRTLSFADGTLIVLDAVARNIAATGAPAILGSPVQGETLSADVGTLADPDGLDPAAIGWQWLRDGVPIPGATGGTLVLTQADVGASLSVRADFVDGFDSAEAADSAGTAPVGNVNDPPEGAAAILGEAVQGAVLTADLSGLGDPDGFDPAAVAFRWLRDGAPIPDATAGSLTLTQADVGAAIALRVAWTDGFGAPEAVETAATEPVANVNDAAQGAPAVLGTAVQGEILTADPGTLADPDGLDPAAIGWQWLRDGVPIPGATGGTLVLTQADVGASLSVQAGYVDGFGAAEAVTGPGTAPVDNVNDPPRGALAILGSPVQGAVLAADLSGLDDPDGFDPATVAFRWLRDGAPIAGATTGNLTLTQADVGAAIALQVAWTDAFGTDETAGAAPTTPVANVNDPPEGGVSIRGAAVEGQVLSADTAALSDPDGLGALSFRWLRGDAPIAGADGDTLLLTGADIGLRIGLQVAWTDGFGAAERVEAGPTGPVAGGGVVLEGGPGDDVLAGTPFDDTLTGGAGDDRLSGMAGVDALFGGSGADTLDGAAGDDILVGGPATDDLRDVIHGGPGRDRADGGAGNDLIHGGDGDDTLDGGDGADELLGQDGADILGGGALSDLIFGGEGDDFLNGGWGHDRLNGGVGADRFFHAGVAGHGSDWIQDYSAAAGDRLVFGGAATAGDFQVNRAETPGAGIMGVPEAFVIHRPTGQILWALVDGSAQPAINLQIGGQLFDLLA